ncbi:unnamed protein product, partial [Mesorhabditis belari]|uniref:Kinesin motor domain-containing protein n=1 Tax=Mesorhabditis belari TaxID=2138241 RepID=A0AAF3J9A1_9BILA
MHRFINSSSSPGSPRPREKQLLNENQEMRKRVNELDHLVQEQEREHKTIASKRAELEHEIKLVKAKAKELQQEVNYKTGLVSDLEKELAELRKNCASQEADISLMKIDFGKTLRALEEADATRRGLDEAKEHAIAQVKSFKEKLDDANAEIDELTAKARTFERAAEDYRRHFEEKDRELNEIVSDYSNHRRAKQADIEAKETQHLEEIRQCEEEIRTLKEKLQVAEESQLEQLRSSENEKKKERAIRDGLQEQIKNLESYNMQFKTMMNAAKDEETSEISRLTAENASLRRQVTEMQEREHVLQTQLFDHQGVINEMNKKNMKLEEMCQKLEKVNSQLEMTVQQVMAREKTAEGTRSEEFNELKTIFGKLEEEKIQLKEKLVAEEKKSYDAFLELSNANNEIETLKEENTRFSSRNKQLEVQLHDTKEDYERKLRDSLFSRDAYVQNLKEAHEKETQLLKENVTRKVIPSSELQGQGSAKAIENELEPRSKQTLSTRNRSSIGPMPLARGYGQQEDKYDKYGRLRELHERNVLARPHLQESYFIEAQSPTSDAIINGQIPKLVEQMRTPAKYNVIIVERQRKYSKPEGSHLCHLLQSVHRAEADSVCKLFEEVFKMALQASHTGQQLKKQKIDYFMSWQKMERAFVCVRARDGNDRVVEASGSTVKLEKTDYKVDRAFDWTASQTDVYAALGKKVVDGITIGLNGTIFAYGQTGSGKTYTMVGPSQIDDFSTIPVNDQGIIPRCIDDLFSFLKAKTDQLTKEKFQSEMHICYVQLYQEEWYDLLDDNVKLQFRTLTGLNAKRFKVTSTAEALELLSKGWNARKTVETKLNSASSQSHCVFVIEVDMKITGNTVMALNSKVNSLNQQFQDAQLEYKAMLQNLQEENEELKLLTLKQSAEIDALKTKICFEDERTALQTPQTYTKRRRTIYLPSEEVRRSVQRARTLNFNDEEEVAADVHIAEKNIVSFSQEENKENNLEMELTLHRQLIEEKNQEILALKNQANAVQAEAQMQAESLTKQLEEERKMASRLERNNLEITKQIANLVEEVKSFKEKLDDANAEIDELTAKARTFERSAEDYRRHFEEKDRELNEIVSDYSNHRRAKQADIEAKETQHLEEIRQCEEEIRTLKEKLQVAEESQLEQLRSSENEKKKERAIRDGLQEQIKNLESYNMQFKTMMNAAKDEETSEISRLTAENASLRRQVTEMQEREHVLQTQFFDRQGVINEMNKKNMKLEEMFQKLEKVNAQLEMTLQQVMAREKTAEGTRSEEFNELKAIFGKLEEEKIQLKEKLVAEEKKSYEAFLELSNANNEIETLKEENTRFSSRNKQLEVQLHDTKEDYERKLRDAYVQNLKEAHEKEARLLKGNATRKVIPSSKLQGQGGAKAIKKELDPRSKQTFSTRNRSSIGPMPLVRRYGQQEDKYDKYGRLRELHERNALARPHLQESYFIESQSPTSDAIINGQIPRLVEQIGTQITEHGATQRMLGGDILSSDADLIHQTTPSNFTEAEKNVETRRLQLIHELLAERGALTIDEIYHYLAGRDTLMAINLPFSNASELNNFVKNRAFVFGYDIFTEKAWNRTFEYRTIFVQVMRYVFFRNKNRCPRSQLMDFLKPELRTGNGLGMKFRRDYPKQFQRFLKQHNLTLEDKDEEIRIRKSAISSIPSLFLTDCLPRIETTQELSGKQRETFWDRSNTFACLGYVVSSTPNYAKAQIMCGPNEGKSVYVLCMNVNLGDISMTEEFPVGQKVELFAHYSYNAKCDYTATAIRKINPIKFPWKIRAGKIGMSKKNILPPTKAGVSQEKSREIEHEITNLIDRETSRLLLIRGLLRNTQGVSLEILSMELAKTGPDAIFSTTEDLIDFIDERPFIFRKQADPDGNILIIERSKMEEQVLLDVLKLISVHKPFGIKRVELYKHLKAGKCGGPLQEELIKGEYVFDQLMRELMPLLKSDAYGGNERVYSLIGTFYKDHFFPYSIISFGRFSNLEGFGQRCFVSAEITLGEAEDYRGVANCVIKAPGEDAVHPIERGVGSHYMNSGPLIDTADAGTHHEKLDLQSSVKLQTNGVVVPVNAPEDAPLIDFSDDADSAVSGEHFEAAVAPSDPLTVMENFVKYEELLEPRDYLTNFYKIRLEQEELRRIPEYSSVIATSPMHFQRNRYRDILPYDSNRVVLRSVDQTENPEGYINASNIDLGGTKFIAAQAPLSTTLGDWWAMIEEYDVSLVVMLCKLIEMSKVKCERYWPEKPGESQIYGDNYEVTVESEERFEDDDEYVLRTLRLENITTKASRTIHQLHYSEWPDHGCPTGEHQLLRMIEKMAEIQGAKPTPILVHCSAGVGRTGTIISVNHIRELIKDNKLSELDLFNLVMHLRTQRSSMVQTQDQYQFVHKCVAHYCKEKLGLPCPEAAKLKNGIVEPEVPRPMENTQDDGNCDDQKETSIPEYPIEPPGPLGPEDSPS